MFSPKSLFVITISVLYLQACTPLLVGGGAVTTASVAHDRRTTGTIIDDNTLEMKLSSKLHGNQYVYNNSHITVTTYNGKVLLTGEAFSPVVVQQAQAITRANDEVKTIINQIVVGRNSTFSERLYDTKQTAKVKTALLGISLPEFDPTRVKVLTEHGVTYLMGLVTQQEAGIVANVVSHVSGVQKVVTLFDIVQR